MAHGAAPRPARGALPHDRVHACVRRPLKKTFRERPSYFAILVNFFPWWMFLVVHFHACLGIAQAIVTGRGSGFADIGAASFSTAAELASYAILTLTVAHLLHVLVAIYHDPPSVGDRVLVYTESVIVSRRANTVIKIGYASVWAGAFFVLAFLDGWFGSRLWWGLIAARLVFIALGNGVAHPLVQGSYIASGLENVRDRARPSLPAHPHACAFRHVQRCAPRAVPCGPGEGGHVHSIVRAARG